MPISANFNIVTPPPLKVYQHQPMPTIQTLLVPPTSPPSIEVPVPELPITLRKGTRSYTTKHLIAGGLSFSHPSITYSAFASALSFLSVCTSYHEVLLDPCGRKLWMRKWMFSIIISLGTLTTLPARKQVVGC